MKPSFYDLCKTLPVPCGSSGDWRVEDFSVSKDESKWTSIRAMLHPMEYVSEGNYKRLMRGDTVVMSNTHMEMRTNVAAFIHATGNVLINGLGRGLVLHAILQKPEVVSVTVVENSPDVIALVAPSFASERVKIIQADAFEYQPEKGVRFGAVWHDIWDDICSDNLPQMAKLHRKYGRRCDWQGSWGKSECQRGR